MDKSLAVFDKYCRSETTKRNYRYFFSKFLDWCKANVDQMITSDGLLSLKESYLQEIVENYIYSLRHKVGPNSYSGPVASIQLFFSMNDKVLNWDKINRLIPASVAKSGKEVWTNIDIKKMLASTTSLRNKAIIHFLASAGCRLGAIPQLRLKDIEDMRDNCKAILIYASSKEEYYGFLTAEASGVLDDYIEKRRKDGEDVNDESFVFREEYRLGIERPKAL